MHFANPIPEEHSIPRDVMDQAIAEAIEAAADMGRVDTLLLGLVRHTTDTVRNNSEQVRKIIIPKSINQLNAVTHKVWRQGGRIVNVLEDQLSMPTRR